MQLEFAGEPIPKARHRHGTSPSGKKITYDIQKKPKEVVKWLALKQLREYHDHLNTCFKIMPSKGAFEVLFEFYIQKPKSKKDTDDPLVKPDLDNLVKFYLDALNGIIWVDDKQVVSLCATKTYSVCPQTVITIHPLRKGERI